MFNQDSSFSGDGSTPADAIRSSAAAQGGRIFIGHTELLCIDGTHTLEETEDLLLRQGLSPACKLLYTDVKQCFENASPAAVLESLRMAERSGLIAVTDISTVLEEWLGDSQTALLPAVDGGNLQMVLLRTDGTCTVLSAAAAQGMYWLRRNSSEDFKVTVETASGMEDIPILRSSLKKSAREGVLCYDLTIYADDCPEHARRPLEEQILSECRSAAAEMLAADADVIGMQSLAEFGQLEVAEVPVEISVTVK